MKYEARIGRRHGTFSSSVICATSAFALVYASAHSAPTISAVRAEKTGQRPQRYRQCVTTRGSEAHGMGTRAATGRRNECRS